MEGRRRYARFGVVLAVIVLAGLVWAETLIHRHPHFEVEKTFGFFVLLGLGAVVLLAVLGRLVRVLFRREEDYYGR